MKRERVLDLVGAQKIIDIASPEFKIKLANRWSDLINPDIKFIIIEHNEYIHIIESLNYTHHKVLEEVFGKDWKI